MLTFSQVIQILKPGIPKRYLLIVAALVWTVGGGMLLVRGFSMMLLFPDFFWLKTAGSIIAGIIFYAFMFSKISLKHIGRIVKIEFERPCLFSFINFRSYFLMLLMISFGITLRMSGFISMKYLSVFYVFMGIPLLISAFRFYYYGINYKKAIKKLG